MKANQQPELLTYPIESTFEKKSRREKGKVMRVLNYKFDHMSYSVASTTK